MASAGDDRRALALADDVRRRVAWARAAQERANRATRRLLWAQGFSEDAKRRAAEARRSVEPRR